MSDQPTSDSSKPCEEVETCIAKTITPDIDNKAKNCAEHTNCDENCLLNRIIFDECIKSCKCNPGEAFRLECFNSCKTNTRQIYNRELFKNFADCLYLPCVDNAASKSITATLIYIIGSVIFISLILFGLMRRQFLRRKKAKENEAAKVPVKVVAADVEIKANANNNINNVNNVNNVNKPVTD